MALPGFEEHFVATDWHEQFKRWAKPPSETEEEKGANAASMIRSAIRESSRLKDQNVEVYATGSYANNTNVRLSSDIDVAIVLHDSLYFDLPDGVSAADVGIATPAAYSFEAFRDDVEAALRATFGAGVRPENKTFSIRENTYRLNADATPFLEHRRYTSRDARGTWQYLEGVELRPRTGPATRIKNWHRQHYSAGVAKNDRTGRRYKRVARILKNLGCAMAETGSQAAKSAAAATPSFLIECLVFNAPDDKFNVVDGSYYDDVKGVVAWLWHRTKPDAEGTKFVEVSGLKWLFQGPQPWTMAQANDFLLQAWYHVGFKND